MKTVEIKHTAYGETCDEVAAIKKQIYRFVLQEVKLQKFLKGQQYHYQMSLNLIDLFESFLPIYKRHLTPKNKIRLYEYYIDQIKNYTKAIKKDQHKFRREIATKHQALKKRLEKLAEYDGLVNEDRYLIDSLFINITKAVAVAKDCHFLQQKNKFLLKEALINEIISSSFLQEYSGQQKIEVIKGLEKINYIFDFNQHARANKASLSFLSNPIRYLAKKPEPLEFCHYLHLKIVNQMSESEIIHHLKSRGNTQKREGLIRMLIACKAVKILGSYNYKINFIVKEELKIAIYNKLSKEYFFNSQLCSITMLLNKIVWPLAKELAASLNFNRYANNYFRYFFDDFENYFSKKNSSHKTEFFINENNLDRAIEIGISEYSKKLNQADDSKLKKIVYNRYLNDLYEDMGAEELKIMNAELANFQHYYLPKAERFKLNPGRKKKFLRALQAIRCYQTEEFDLMIEKVAKRHISNKQITQEGISEFTSLQREALT